MATARPSDPGRRDATCFHVAPWGRDHWPGTERRPFATLGRAQRAVRAVTAGMRSDVVVSLRGGTYRLAQPLELLAGRGDSGENGHRVVYQAHGYGSAHQEEVVLSGGREITGFKLHDAARNVWRADAGSLRTRQLFVNGRRAPRASVPASALGALRRDAAGYLTDSAAPLSWHGPGALEMVYQGAYPWAEARCGVTSIRREGRSTRITMAQPAFGWGSALYNGHRPTAPDEEPSCGDHNGFDAPTSVENSLSFLTEPGTFVLDVSRPRHHVLFYRPREDEDLARATVVAPVLETLVRGRGAGRRTLQDVVLRGLTFAHATWLRPSGRRGFLHFHGGAYYDGGGLQRVGYAEGQAWVTAPGAAPATMPGNVVFQDTARILVEGNRFVHLGAAALELSGRSVDCGIRGNVFCDVSGGAITLGGGPSRGNRIENNSVREIGREYHGSPAISVTDTEGTLVAHNEIRDVPHCGIVVNGGEAARRVHVLENLVSNTMKVLADGGGIYVTGPQGTSFGSGAVVRGNVIHDTVTSYNYGLYTDYGACWVTVLANVIYRGDTPIVLHVSPPLANVAFIGNFWDGQPERHDQPPETVIVGGNTHLPRDGFEQAVASIPAGADIVRTAGLEAPWRHLARHP